MCLTRNNGEISGWLVQDSFRFPGSGGRNQQRHVEVAQERPNFTPRLACDDYRHLHFVSERAYSIQTKGGDVFGIGIVGLDCSTSLGKICTNLRVDPPNQAFIWLLA